MKDQSTDSSDHIQSKQSYHQPLLSNKLKNLLLIGGVVALALIPLFVVKDGKFGGADDQGKEAITKINPNYKPWFESLTQPASSEVAGLLFAVQAALGAGVLGYAIGLYKGRSEVKKLSQPPVNQKIEQE
jgi:cobalt/nickel transport protein